MARAGILYSYVAQAAAKLVEDGKNPTVDNVRAALGGTGSKSTIAPFLKRWKAEHQEAVAETGLGIPATLLQAVKGVYEQLQADVNQKLAQAQQAHQAALQTASDTTQQLRTEHQTLSDTHATLAATLERAQAALAHLQADHHAVNVTMAGLQSENTGLRQRLGDRAVEVSALNQQLTQARVQFEHYQEAMATQRAEERQAAEQRCARLEQELASTQHRLVAQQSTLGQQEAQLTHLANEKNRLRDTARIAQEELAQLRPARDQLAYQARELSTARRELSGKLDSTQQALTDSRVALAAQEKETQLLTEQLVRAQEKAEKLTQEKLALLQERAASEAQHAQETGDILAARTPVPDIKF